MASDNLSPEDVRHILKSNRAEIVSVIKKNIDSLLDYLIEDDAISEPVCDRIKAEKIPQDRARELLDHVSSVGEKAFLSLKRGLKETKCDNLLQAIEAEEDKRKKEKIAEKRKRRPRASLPTVPTPTPSNPPSIRPKLWTVKGLANFFDTSAHSYGEHYSGRASKDNGRSKTSESFKGDKYVQQESVCGTSVAGSSVTCNISSDLSEDDVPGETAVKQAADSLNDLNIGLNASSACSNTPQIRSVNMLLVGCKGNGKSSTGNSILGETCFMYKRRGGTSKASLQSGSFHGQCEDVLWDMKVVDTPGISQEMTKSEFTEVVHGVNMLSKDVCSTSSEMSPGIDAIVLVWSCDHTDSNVERECHVLQSLHRLFGDALYEYLVIAVTRARCLYSVEEYVQELPEPLREIERKCSGRLVTFENGTGVHFSEDIEQSKEELFNTVYSLSNKNQYRYTTDNLSPMCIIPKGNELRLALMGKTGVGKSSTGNSIVGCEKFTTACAAASVTSDCPYHTRKKPRKVAVVDSPGVLFTDTGVCDKDRLVDQLSSIAAIYHTKGLHSMLLVISGSQRFTQEDKDTVRYLRAVFGDRLLQDYTIIVITGKDNIESDKNVMGDVETYLSNARTTGLQEVLELCNHRVVFFNNKTQDETIQRMQLGELVRMIDDIVQRNDGPYIDANFREGKAVAVNIKACSKLSTKFKSTPELPGTSRSLASLHFSDEKSHSEDLEMIILPTSERHPASPDPFLPAQPKQPLPRSSRPRTITVLPIRSISSTSLSFRDQKCFYLPIARADTESDDETFTDEFESERTQTPASMVGEQFRTFSMMQSQESLEGPYRGASASPLSPRQSEETFPLSPRQSEETFQRHDVCDLDTTEERVRHVAALSNLRLTKLWRTIRKKLRFKRNSVVPLTIHHKEAGQKIDTE